MNRTTRGKQLAHGAMLWAALSPLFSANAFACPAYIPAKLVSHMPKGNRQDVRIFAIDDAGGARHWRSLPVQIDALDANGVLSGDAETGPTLAQSPMLATDRIDLRRENFGRRATPADPSPCRGATRAVEIANPETLDRYAYLTTCPNDLGKTEVPGPNPVALDPNIQKITAPRFEYDYQPNNQLMYRNLIAKNSQGQSVLAATDADLNMHLDVKSFFTMDFTNSDVGSYVGNVSNGKVGLVGSMDFFLNLLFFKIKLKMSTTVAFFGDSGHIPAVVDVPVESPNRLHPGSGLLYVWTRKAATVDQTAPAKTMPNADPKAILAGTAKLAPVGLPYCKSDVCVFRLRGHVQDDMFGIDVNVPKPMVEQGFFPQWVDNVATFKKNMEWDDEPTDANDRVAIYFENSGLHKGQYQFEQWIRLGQGSDFASTCPRAVKVLAAFPFHSVGGTAH